MQVPADRRMVPIAPGEAIASTRTYVDALEPGNPTAPAAREKPRRPDGLRGSRVVAQGEVGELDLRESLIEVGDDVIDVLDTDGETDEVLGEVSGLELLLGELGVGGGGGVDDE